MKEIKFNSQICTSREQSERLLGLGLKKETADMTWKFSYLLKGVPQYDCLAESTWDKVTMKRYEQHCSYLNLHEHWKRPDGTQMSSEEVYAEITNKDIPAWSLHRLIEMMPEYVHKGNANFERTLFPNSVDYFRDLYKDCGDVVISFDSPNLYDRLIHCIEWLIKNEYFNKEYLV